jgi:ABC-2 type transport system permease protein
MIGKFIFSSMGCLLVGEFLIVFSNLMLGMPWLIIAVHMVTIAILGLGFSGMSVGLGACMPNFRETDPSKIAVGFGGTVNLVVSLLLLTVVIMTMATPLHLLYGRAPDQELPLSEIPWTIWASMLAGTIVGGVSVWLPMRAGMRNLRELEF